MNLLTLAARVSHEFSANSSQQMRTVQSVKNDQVRDVVTALDRKLHDISQEFVAEWRPGCKVLSEEDERKGFDIAMLREGEWLVIDPLDGSNNYALEMPNYGYMAAHLANGRVGGAVIVLPEHNQYIVLESGDSLYAQPLPSADAEYGTVYYAYPPTQDIAAGRARVALMALIDADSAGMYRYGSACAGLYQFLCGRHMAFIGHGIRLWDAIAFLPVLASREISFSYAMQAEGITLVASAKADFLESAEHILQKQQGLALHSFHPEIFRYETQ